MGAETKLSASPMWTNSDNRQFYSSIGVEGLRRRVEQCGLCACPDLEALWRFMDGRFTAPSSILEIGAGTGRVADWLRARSPQAKLTLLELSRESSDHLKSRFHADSQVVVANGNVLDFTFPQKYPLALWMWSGCIDFNYAEKRQAIRNVANALMPNGLLAIEINRTFGKDVTVDSSGNLTLDFQGVRYHGHVVGPAEIASLAVASGLIPIAEIFYETANGLKRTIHLLQKLEIN